MADLAADGGTGLRQTRAGAEWVLARARAQPKARIALIGGSIDEVAKVMVEGESGLLVSARAHERLTWRSSTGKLLLPNEGLAIAYSGATPGRLRGPQHHFAWADELGNYRHDKTEQELDTAGGTGRRSISPKVGETVYLLDRETALRVVVRSVWTAPPLQQLLRSLRRSDRRKDR